MIQEITRRCYVNGIFQAIYTAGIILPKPISSCTYFHRSLNWEKLHDVKFAGLPPGSTKSRQISKYKLPSTTSTPGLREMQTKDVDNVLDLLQRYLSRADLAQGFSREEIEHWLLNKNSRPSTSGRNDDGEERVVWAYVVEEPETHKITDFVSFYALNSTVIGNTENEQVRAVYLYYYATEAAFGGDRATLKIRLNALMRDALVLARNVRIGKRLSRIALNTNALIQENFDVFNALTLLDNPLFLEEQKFNSGDGQLHYYLYNYRASPVVGGVDPKNKVDERYMGGVGVVML